MNDIVYQHEVIVPDRGLPFKLFLFEGGGGKYIREKHWHRSIEIFAVRQGQLDFFLNEKKYVLAAGEFVLVNSNGGACDPCPSAKRDDCAADSAWRLCGLLYGRTVYLVFAQRKRG